MDYNARHSAEREQNLNPDRRHLEENQRIGKNIYRDRGDQNPTDQYRSGQSYHNRNEGYDREHTHYGARPDSAYRDQNRINYGDNRQNQPGQHYGQNQNRYQDQNYNQNQNRYQNQNRNTGDNQFYRGQNTYGDRRNDYYNDPPQGEHGGTRFWGEREGYKQDDYRYTSGNRGNWEAPGIGKDKRNDDDDRNRYQNNYRHDRNYDQDRDRGFFDRMGDSISNAWNSMAGNDDDNNYDDRNRNQHPQNRNFNRGYESGPRWADENDRYDRDRHNNRRRYDD